MLENEVEKMISTETMPQKHKSLGRGLGALLGDDDFDDNVKASQGEGTSVDISLIKPSRFQPRTEFDEEALKALAQSIKDKGILQPLLVRKTDFGYELIAGERRWRAAQIAGVSKVPVIEKNLDDKEVLEVALVENLLRENLSAIEEAEALQRLMNEFSHTQEALSQTIGKSRSYIANTLRLLNLPENIKKMVKDGRLTAGHARQLIGLENAEQIAEQIIKKCLNVRQVEELVAKLKAPAKTEKKKNLRNEDVIDIEKSLNQNLGLRIKITPSKQGGGKVVLQYASPAELDMIIDILEQKRNTQSTNTPVMVAPSTPMPAPATNEKFSIKIVD